MLKSLNIFDYSDYRSFVRDWIQQAKQAKTFTLSKLAEVIQVHPTFLSQVLTGTKDLSLEQAAFMSRQLELTKLEQEYFFVLIQLDRAGTQLLKNHWLAKKKEIEIEKNKLGQRVGEHRELSSEQMAEFYSSWIYIAVWTATSIDGGQTLDQIAERFQISRERAGEILSFLVQTGLSKQSDGVFRWGESHLHLPNESPFVTKHHMNWRVRALQQLEGRSPSELFFTATTAISKQDFDVVREKLNFAIQEIAQIAQASPAEEVVNINIDFFRAVR